MFRNLLLSSDPSTDSATAMDSATHTAAIAARMHSSAAAIGEAPPPELGVDYVPAHIEVLANSTAAQRADRAHPLAAGDPLTWGLVVCQTPILGNPPWPGP